MTVPGRSLDARKVATTGQVVSIGAGSADADPPPRSPRIPEALGTVVLLKA